MTFILQKNLTNCVGSYMQWIRTMIIGASLSEPDTSKCFVGSSFYEYKRQKTNTKPYKFLCDTKVLYSIQNLPYSYRHWIVNVAEACDKVLLNGHGYNIIVIWWQLMMSQKYNYRIQTPWPLTCCRENAPCG